jgi:hypothetical protein
MVDAKAGVSLGAGERRIKSTPLPLATVAGLPVPALRRQRPFAVNFHYRAFEDLTLSMHY